MSRPTLDLDVRPLANQHRAGYAHAKHRAAMEPRRTLPAAVVTFVAYAVPVIATTIAVVALIVWVTR